MINHLSCFLVFRSCHKFTYLVINHHISFLHFDAISLLSGSYVCYHLSRIYVSSAIIVRSSSASRIPAIPLLTMDSSTAKIILSLHRDLQSWTQPFWFEMNNIKLDLSLAIGSKALTPPGSEQYQPQQYPVLGKNKQTTSRF